MSYMLAVGALTALISMVGCGPATGNAQAGAVTVFRNVRVFDGAQVHERTTVLVRDGTIEAVGPDVTAPRGATLIEGEGRTLLPGLIDAHTHSGGFRRILEAALVFGVTTMLDMASNPANVSPLREEQTATGAPDRADLFSAGRLVTAPGGHGTQYPTPVPTIQRPDEAPGLVADRLAEGSDYIKIVYDAWAADLGPGDETWRRPSIDRATLGAVIRAAHDRDKLAVVHVLDQRSAREALLEGADGLVHLFTTAEGDAPGDVAAIARERGAFVIPTLAVLLAPGAPPDAGELLGDPALSPFLSPDQAQALAAAVPPAPWQPDPAASRALLTATLGQLRTAGVPILAGTDAPNPGTSFGVSLHGEMRLLVKLGLTPIEALTAATAAPAQVFGLSNRGRIAPGFRADLVLVEGDPTVEVRATRSIVGVWKVGVAVDRNPTR